MPFLRRREVSARTLHAEIAKTDEGSVRLTTACLKGVARDEGRRRPESAGAPAAVSVPPISPRGPGHMPINDGVGVRAPVDVIETSRKRSAEDAGHETDDADQESRGSMAGDSIQEAVRDAGVLGSDAVALRKRTRQHGASNELVRLARVQAWRWIFLAWDGI